MRIAVCDDDKKDAAAIQFIVSGVSDAIVECFNCGEKLLKRIKENIRFDCIFLDVFLKEESGIVLADTVRKLNPETEIVFVTFSKEFALDAFRLGAIDYLVKPVNEEAVIGALKRVKYGVVSTKPIIVKNAGEITALNPDSILRIESNGHYTRLVKGDGKTSSVHINFSELHAKLGDRFLEIRRGLAINMNYIVQIYGKEIVLVDGSVCEISRGRKDDVIETYTKFITEKRDFPSGSVLPKTV